MKLLLTLLALGALTDATWAGVPDPRFSDVPFCIGVCPGGDLSYSIDVRDVNSRNLPNVVVTLDLSQCAALSVLVCDGCPGASVFNNPGGYYQGVTDANGVVTFRICGELHCPSGGRAWVRVYAAGIWLGNVATVTPDVNGDLVVDALDVAQVTAAEGGTLPQDDLDCNGVVNAADVAIVSAHLGHFCADNLPTIPRSWGTVKAVYR